MTRGPLLPCLLAVLTGVAYGALGRFTFDYWSKSNHGATQAVVAAMTVSFLFLVPLALGVLTAALCPKDPQIQPYRWVYWIFMPPLSALLLMLGTIALAWEGWICIVMAGPIFLVMSVLGGVAWGLVDTFLLSPRAAKGVVASCVIAPFLLGPLENRLPSPTALRDVETVVTIEAPAEVVWGQVVRVPAIRREEAPDGFFQKIGIPRPHEATLSHDGIGGLREASFEGGILFHEVITEWEEKRRLGFDIRVDHASVSPDVLDQHVRVGGPFFDVLHGTFVLEAQGPKRTVLRLSSRHRLSTRFNFYSSFWTDAVMQDIQQRICHVIQQRSEARAR